MINKTDSLQQSIEEHIRARRVSDKSLLDMSIQNQKLNQQNADLVSEVVIAKLKENQIPLTFFHIDRQFERSNRSIKDPNSFA